MYRLYKSFISPVLTLLFGGGCRFTPTCSDYARQAVHRHGWGRGSVMALWRVLKCQPFYSGKLHDPVQ